MKHSLAEQQRRADQTREEWHRKQDRVLYTFLGLSGLLAGAALSGGNKINSGDYGMIIKDGQSGHSVKVDEENLLHVKCISNTKDKIFYGLFGFISALILIAVIKLVEIMG